MSANDCRSTTFSWRPDSICRSFAAATGGVTPCGNISLETPDKSDILNVSRAWPSIFLSLETICDLVESEYCHVGREAQVLHGPLGPVAPANLVAKRFSSGRVPPVGRDEENLFRRNV